MIAVLKSRCKLAKEAQDLAATVTSRGWVMLSATRKAGLVTSASTIITRCIIPPLNWNGNSWKRCLGEGMRTRVEQTPTPARRPRLLLRDGLDGAKLLHDLVADGNGRIKRAARIGADIGDFPPSQTLHLAFGQAAADRVRGRADCRSDPQRLAYPVDERTRQHSLSRAALADDPDHLVFGERERHVAEKRDRAWPPPR